MPEETMRVRVCDRGTGPGYSGVRIRTVEISTQCQQPGCDAPRGKPFNHNFHEDGEWLSVDMWRNPCGHIDFYVDVLKEAGVR